MEGMMGLVGAEVVMMEEMMVMMVERLHGET